MNNKEIKKIKEQIDRLPKGSISVKKINGKEYEYWQFTENGKQISRRVKGAELLILQNQIEERRRLEALLMKDPGPESEKTLGEVPAVPPLNTSVRTGDELLRFAGAVRNLKKRECYRQLEDYIYGPTNDRVFILYGLRRTGKTTLIRQVIWNMPPDILGETAFIQISPKNTLSDVNKDLRILESFGYKYVFIDEATLMEDFIEGAALFSDVYASSEMKIVLSGTDSLGFIFSESEELYDRCVLLHTTFIPYREFAEVLGIKGIDEYIRYGGTMSLGGVNYNLKRMPFATESSTNEYIDSAIARNIQHSLKNYQYGGHFRHLITLYEKDELTGAINRVVEDINHRFTLEVLTGRFKSHDLGISKTNLRKDREKPTSILDEISIDDVTNRLKQILEIREKEEQTAAISDVHASEIEEYLKLLDLIEYIDEASARDSAKYRRTVFTQPGLRYSQAEALIVSLMEDQTFRSVGIKERSRITQRILDEIRGRMMEDIILLETKQAMPGKQVFPLRFAVGEFDMVIFDPEQISCEIYEIKHSDKTAAEQYRHLIDKTKCKETEKQYGEITRRCVLYRGPRTDFNGIEYLNVEEYLSELGTV